MSLHIRQITLVSLSPRRTLLVVVTEDGQVLNRSLEFADDVEAEDLAHVQTLFNEVFAGKSLAEIKDSLNPETARALGDPLAQVLMSELFECREGRRRRSRPQHRRERAAQQARVREPPEWKGIGNIYRFTHKG